MRNFYVTGQNGIAEPPIHTNEHQSSTCPFRLVTLSKRLFSCFSSAGKATGFSGGRKKRKQRSFRTASLDAIRVHSCSFVVQGIPLGQLLVFFVLLLVVLGGFASCRPEEEAKVVVWANASATTPVLPLYALQEPSWEFREWNTTVAFQSLLLAGDGVFWVGHLEGFARACQHGAPLQLLAVTGWRKWQILSRHAEWHFPEDFLQGGVGFAPSDGAGRFLLEALLKEQDLSMTLKPMEMRQMMLKALDGQLDSVVIPEPFATALLKKDSSFHRISSLEEYYGRCRNCAPEVPWAGIAVHREWASSHPEEMARVVEKLGIIGGELAAMTPAQAAEFWPLEKERSAGISRTALADSLERDPVKVVLAKDMIPQLREFLAIVAPEIPFNEGMVWK